jgi:hypothetical protein
VPSGSVDTFELEPIFYHFPKSSSVPASEEEVVDGFLHALAKRTTPAIGPPLVGQTASNPYPILHGQPREKFDLGRGPGFPHRKLHGGVDDAKELGQVGGLGSVYPALCVFTQCRLRRAPQEGSRGWWTKAQ